MEELESSITKNWEDIIREELEEHSIESVRETYKDLLEKNLRVYLDELPAELREDLAKTSAKVYGDQIEEIFESAYLDSSNFILAVTTAFLTDSNLGSLGVRVRSQFRNYQGELRDLDQEKYERRALKVLSDPWPQIHLNPRFESVERFKDPEDDPAYY